MNIGGDWVFGSFEGRLVLWYYENFIVSMDCLRQHYTGFGRPFFPLVCMFMGLAIGYCIQKGVGKVGKSREK